MHHRDTYLNEQGSLYSEKAALLVAQQELVYERNYVESLFWTADGQSILFRTLTDNAISITKVLDLVLGRGHTPAEFYVTAGVCCDRAWDGSYFELSPFCPCCSDLRVVLEDVPEPYEIRNIVMRETTHYQWNGMTVDQKVEVISAKLRAFHGSI